MEGEEGAVAYRNLSLFRANNEEEALNLVSGRFPLHAHTHPHPSLRTHAPPSFPPPSSPCPPELYAACVFQKHARWVTEGCQSPCIYWTCGVMQLSRGDCFQWVSVSFSLMGRLYDWLCVSGLCAVIL